MIVIIVWVFLLIGFHNSSANKDIPEHEKPTDDRFVLNTVIRQLFELFRNVVKNGNLEKNIPILDPYEFDYATFGVNANIMSASVNFTNGVFMGLGDYELGPFTFEKTSLSIDLELTFPLISFVSEYYKLGGFFYGIFPFSGRGAIQIEVYDMFVKGKMYLKQSDDEKSILVSRFENVEFTIDNIKSNIQFDGNIDGIANAMIEDLIPGYLSRFSRAICATYGDVLVRAMNSILDKYESWKIISVIL